MLALLSISLADYRCFAPLGMTHHCRSCLFPLIIGSGTVQGIARREKSPNPTNLGYFPFIETEIQPNYAIMGRSQTMYQNLRRGQLYLKSFPAQSPTNNFNGPSRSIAVLAVLLFALAGLMTGFAVR